MKAMNMLHSLYHFFSIEMKVASLRIKVATLRFSRRFKWLQPA